MIYVCETLGCANAGVQREIEGDDVIGASTGDERRFCLQCGKPFDAILPSGFHQHVWDDSPATDPLAPSSVVVDTAVAAAAAALGVASPSMTPNQRAAAASAVRKQAQAIVDQALLSPA